MEEEKNALNSVLGLELNRVFFAIREKANKERVIEFARAVLESERIRLVDGGSPENPPS
jgi:hypothetical protein